MTNRSEQNWPNDAVNAVDIPSPTETRTKLTTIPFSGFYESIHSQELDRALGDMVTDSSGCRPISERLGNDIWDGIHWGDAMRAYAVAYSKRFAGLLREEYGIEVTWESISSPREYNFTTEGQ